MLTTQDIIRKIWDAQGYGNLAVWDDGSTQVIEPGETPLRGGNSPRAVFKPIPLVARFPMLDNALYNPELRDTIERTIRDAGGSIERE